MKTSEIEKQLADYFKKLSKSNADKVQVHDLDFSKIYEKNPDLSPGRVRILAINAGLTPVSSVKDARGLPAGQMATYIVIDKLEEADELEDSSIDQEAMLDSYLTTMLWSSTDESDPNGGEPMDKNYGIDDIDEASIAKAKKDISKFVSMAGELLKGLDASQVGHDLWLTRNGHGAGFWDGDYEEEVGEKLTQISKKLGEVYPYVGDDKKIYAEGKVEEVTTTANTAPYAKPLGMIKKKQVSESQSPKEKKAFELGVAANKAGKKAVPAMDKDLMAMVKDMGGKIGSSSSILDAWSKGFQSVNDEAADAVLKEWAYDYKDKAQQKSQLIAFIKDMMLSRIENDKNDSDYDEENVGDRVEDQLTGLQGEVNGKKVKDVYKELVAGMSDKEIRDAAEEIPEIVDIDDGWVYYDGYDYKQAVKGKSEEVEKKNELEEKASKEMASENSEVLRTIKKALESVKGLRVQDSNYTASGVEADLLFKETSGNVRHYKMTLEKKYEVTPDLPESITEAMNWTVGMHRSVDAIKTAISHLGSSASAVGSSKEKFDEILSTLNQLPEKIMDLYNDLQDEKEGDGQWRKTLGSSRGQSGLVSKLPNGKWTYKVIDTASKETIFDGSDYEKYQYAKMSQADDALKANFDKHIVGEEKLSEAMVSPESEKKKFITTVQDFINKKGVDVGVKDNGDHLVLELGDLQADDIDGGNKGLDSFKDDLAELFWDMKVKKTYQSIHPNWWEVKPGELKITFKEEDEDSDQMEESKSTTDIKAGDKVKLVTSNMGPNAYFKNMIGKELTVSEVLPFEKEEGDGFLKVKEIPETHLLKWKSVKKIKEVTEAVFKTSADDLESMIQGLSNHYMMNIFDNYKSSQEKEIKDGLISVLKASPEKYVTSHFGDTEDQHKGQALAGLLAKLVGDYKKSLEVKEESPVELVAEPKKTSALDHYFAHHAVKKGKNLDGVMAQLQLAMISGNEEYISELSKNMGAKKNNLADLAKRVMKYVKKNPKLQVEESERHQGMAKLFLMESKSKKLIENKEEKAFIEQMASKGLTFVKKVNNKMIFVGANKGSGKITGFGEDGKLEISFVKDENGQVSFSQEVDKDIVKAVEGALNAN